MNSQPNLFRAVKSHPPVILVEPESKYKSKSVQGDILRPEVETTQNEIGRSAPSLSLPQNDISHLHVVENCLSMEASTMFLELEEDVRTSYAQLRDAFGFEGLDLAKQIPSAPQLPPSAQSVGVRGQNQRRSSLCLEVERGARKGPSGMERASTARPLTAKPSTLRPLTKKTHDDNLLIHASLGSMLRLHAAESNLSRKQKLLNEPKRPLSSNYFAGIKDVRLTYVVPGSVSMKYLNEEQSLVFKTKLNSQNSVSKPSARIYINQRPLTAFSTSPQRDSLGTIPFDKLPESRKYSRVQSAYARSHIIKPKADPGASILPRLSTENFQAELHSEIKFLQDRISNPGSLEQHVAKLSGEAEAVAAQIKASQCQIPSEKELPLDWFDDFSYEPFSTPYLKSLQKNFPEGMPAYSRYFPNGPPSKDAIGWTWKPCHVLSFDPDTQLFEILWEQSISNCGINLSGHKHVRRLNVLFAHEDSAKFHKRIEVAMALRAQVIRESQYSHAIRSCQLSSVALLEDEVKGRIVQRIGIPITSQRMEDILVTCMAEVEAEYLLSVKKVTLDHLNPDIGYVKDEDISKRFAHMTIARSEYREENAADEQRIVAADELKQRVTEAAQILSPTIFLANPYIQQCMVEVFACINQVIKDDELFFCQRPTVFSGAHEFPTPVQDYVDKSYAYASWIQSKLAYQWPGKVIKLMEDTVGKFFNFRMHDLAQYSGSRTQHFLYYISSVMETHVERIALTGCANFIKLFQIRFLEKVVTAGTGIENSVISYSLDPPIYVPLLFTLEMGLWVEEEGSINEGSQSRASKYFSFPATSPFKAEAQKLTESTTVLLPARGCFGLNHTLPRLLQYMDELLMLPINFTKNCIPKVENTVMVAVFEGVEPQYLQTLSQKHELLPKGRHVIHGLIEAAFPKIQAMEEKFSPYVFLLSEPSKPIYKAFSCLPDYEEEFKRLAELQIQVLRITKDRFVSRPFILETQSAMFYLHKRVQVRIQKLKSLLITWMHATYECLNKDYFQLFSIIIDDPGTDTRKWSSLNSVLVSFAEKIRGLDVRVAEFKEIWDFLLSYQVIFTDEEMQTFYSLYNWPKKIGTEMEAAYTRSEERKRAILAQLALDTSATLAKNAEYWENLQKLRDVGDIEDSQAMSARVSQMRGIMEEILQKSKDVNRREVDMLIPVTSFAKCLESEAEFSKYEKLWITAWELTHKIRAWLDTYFLDLDTVALVTQLEKWSNAITELQSALNGISSASKVMKEMSEQLNSFKNRINVVLVLRNPALQQRHWIKLTRLIGVALNDLRRLKASQVIRMDLDLVYDIIADITDDAGGEEKVMGTLENFQIQMKQTMLKSRFDAALPPSFYFLEDFDYLLHILDDQIANSNFIMKLAITCSLGDKVKAWIDRLLSAEQTLDVLEDFQQKFALLPGIFDKQDFKALMQPDDLEKYRKIISNFAFVSKILQTSSNLLTVVLQNQLLEQIRVCQKDAEHLLSNFRQFLDYKRAKFSRFLFLADDELLELITTGKDKIHRYTSLCFDAVERLCTAPMDVSQADSGEEIHSIQGKEGELVKLEQAVIHSGRLHEDWLNDLDEALSTTIRMRILHAVAEIRQNGADFADEFLHKHLIQAIFIAVQIFWEEKLELMIDQDGTTVKNFRLLLVKRIESLAKSIMSNGINVRDTPSIFSALIRRKYELTILVLVQTLHSLPGHSPISSNISSKRLNYEVSHLSAASTHSSGSGKIMVKIGKGLRQEYGYEYLGVSERILQDNSTVNTIYSLAQQSGGNFLTPCALVGLPGSGKRELVQELSTAFGRRCFFFKCYANMPFEQIHRIFNAYLRNMSNSWVCLLDLEYVNTLNLSALSSNIKALGLALLVSSQSGGRAFKFNEETFPFYGGANFVVSYTMPPSSTGQEWIGLPTSLKTAFRAVVLAGPSDEVVLELILVSHGIQYASQHARKICALAVHCRALLGSKTKACIYNFELVKMKIVARLAIKEYFCSPSFSKHNAELPEQTAAFSAFITNAFRNVFAAQLQPEDQKIFLNFMIRSKNYVEEDSLISSLKDACLKNNILPSEGLVSRLASLAMSIQHSRTIIFHGPFMSGKTTSLKLLQSAINLASSDGQAKDFDSNAHPKHAETLWNQDSSWLRRFQIFPKALTGNADMLCKLYHVTQGNSKPTIFDTVIHAVDEHNQCRSNHSSGEWESRMGCSWVHLHGITRELGEILPSIFPETVGGSEFSGALGKKSLGLLSTRVILEMQDLDALTPSLLARAIIVYACDEEVSSQDFLYHELKLLPIELQELASYIEVIILSVIIPLFCYADQLENLCSSISRIHGYKFSIGQFFKVFTTLFADFGPERYSRFTAYEQHKWIFAMCLVSCLWTRGSFINSVHKTKFDGYVRSRAFLDLLINAEKKNHINSGYLTEVAEFPQDSDHTIYDYFYDDKMFGWILWSEFESLEKIILQKNRVPNPFKYTAITPEAQVIIHMANILLKSGHCVRVKGPKGCGKTEIIREVMSHVIRGRHQPAFRDGHEFLTSSLGDADSFRKFVESNLVRKGRYALGLSGNSRRIIFVDDLQELTESFSVFGSRKQLSNRMGMLELLKMWSDVGGWYAGASRDFRLIEDVSVIYGETVAAPSFSVDGLWNSSDAAISCRRTFIDIKMDDDVVKRAKNLVPCIMSHLDQVVVEYQQQFSNISLDFLDRLHSIALENKKFTHRPTFLFKSMIHCLKIFAVNHNQWIQQSAKGEVAAFQEMAVRYWAYCISRGLLDNISSKFHSDKRIINELIDSTVMLHFPEISNSHQSFSNAEQEDKEGQGDLGAIGLQFTLYSNKKGSTCKDILKESITAQYGADNWHGVSSLLNIDGMKIISKLTHAIRAGRSNIVLFGQSPGELKQYARLAACAGMCEFMELDQTLTNAPESMDLFWWKLLSKLASRTSQRVVIFVNMSTLKGASFEISRQFLEDFYSLLNHNIPLALCKMLLAVDDGKRNENLSEYEHYRLLRLHILSRIKFVLSDITFKHDLPGIFSISVDDRSSQGYNELVHNALSFLAKELVPASSDTATLPPRGISEDKKRSIALFLSEIFAAGGDYLNDKHSSRGILIDLNFTLKLFSEFFRERDQGMRSSLLQLNTATKTLITALETVQTVKVEHAAWQAKIEDLGRRAQLCMQKLEEERHSYEKVSIQYKKSKALVADLRKEKSEIEELMQEENENVKPTLNLSMQEVSFLDERDIQELRLAVNPPRSAEIIVEIVCDFLRTQKNDGESSWDRVKRAVTLPDFLQNLRAFQPTQIDHEMDADKIMSHVDDPDFAEAYLLKFLPCLPILWDWVRIMIKAYQVSVRNGLRLERLDTIADHVERLESDISSIKSLNDEQETRMIILRKEFDTLISDKEKATTKFKEIARYQNDSAALVSAIKELQQEMNKRLEHSELSYTCLIKDSLIAACYISFCGPHVDSRRRIMISDWHAKLMALNLAPPGTNSDNFSLAEFMYEKRLPEILKSLSFPRDLYSLSHFLIAKTLPAHVAIYDPTGLTRQIIRSSSNQIQEYSTYKMNDDIVRQISVKAMQFIVRVNSNNLPPLLGRLLSYSRSQKLTFESIEIQLAQKGNGVLRVPKEFKIFFIFEDWNQYQACQAAWALDVPFVNATLNKASHEVQSFHKLLEQAKLDSLYSKFMQDERTLRQGSESAFDLLMQLLLRLDYTELSSKPLQHEIMKLKDDIKGDPYALSKHEQQSTNILSRVRPLEIISKTIASVFETIQKFKYINYVYEMNYNDFTSLCIHYWDGNSVLPNEKDADLLHGMSEVVRIPFLKYVLGQMIHGIEQHDQVLLCFMLISGHLFSDTYQRFLIRGRKSRMFTESTSGPALPTNPTKWLSKNIWKEICDLSNINGFSDLYESFALHGNRDFDHKERISWQDLFESSDFIDSAYPPFEGCNDPYFSKIKRVMVLASIRPETLYMMMRKRVEDTFGAGFLIPPYPSTAIYDILTNSVPKFIPNQQNLVILSQSLPSCGFRRRLDDLGAAIKSAASLIKPAPTVVQLYVDTVTSRQFLSKVKESRKNNEWLVIGNLQAFPDILSDLVQEVTNWSKIAELPSKTTTSPDEFQNFRIFVILPLNLFKAIDAALYRAPITSLCRVSHRLLFNDTSQSPRNVLRYCLGFVLNVLSEVSLEDHRPYKRWLFKYSVFYTILMARLGRDNSFNAVYDFSQADFKVASRRMLECFSVSPAFSEKAIPGILEQLVLENYYLSKVRDPWDRTTLTALFRDLLEVDWRTFPEVTELSIPVSRAFHDLFKVYIETSIEVQLGEAQQQSRPQSGLCKLLSAILAIPDEDALLPGMMGLSRASTYRAELHRSTAIRTSLTKLIDGQDLESGAIKSGKHVQFEDMDKISGRIDVHITVLMTFVTGTLFEAEDNETPPTVTYYDQRHYRHLDYLLAKNVSQYRSLLEQVKLNLSLAQAYLRHPSRSEIFITPLLASILRDEVPHEWTQAGYGYTCQPNFTLTQWIQDLGRRLSWVHHSWASKREKLVLYDMSKLFRPEGLVQSLIADFAHFWKEPADRIEVSWHVMSTEPSLHSSKGIYITGMFLHNASWDSKNNLLCQMSTLERHCSFPVVLLQPKSPEKRGLANRNGGEAGGEASILGVKASSSKALIPGSSSRHMEGDGNEEVPDEYDYNLSKTKAKYRCPIYAYKLPFPDHSHHRASDVAMTASEEGSDQVRGQSLSNNHSYGGNEASLIPHFHFVDEMGLSSDLPVRTWQRQGVFLTLTVPPEF